jgi:endonuclease/exonuclease/phosphatase family metal-dependent hydrolase
MLQMNLCNSGSAGCFTGRSLALATALIRDEAPDLVTVNEVCRDDMPVLQRALAGVTRDGATSWAFQAADDRRTGDVVRCRDGQPYGIGLVSRGAPRAGAATGGIYPVQDVGDREQRAWLCLDVMGFAACTTHLDNSGAAVARAQCDYLLDTAIPGVRTRLGNAPVLLGGDLNLPGGASSDLRSCLHAEDRSVDDGGVQHVVASSEFGIVSRRTIDMRATTDHPGLLVTLALGAPAPADGADVRAASVAPGQDLLSSELL